LNVSENGFSVVLAITLSLEGAFLAEPAVLVAKGRKELEQDFHDNMSLLQKALTRQLDGLVSIRTYVKLLQLFNFFMDCSHLSSYSNEALVLVFHDLGNG
jgi:hypothetical protein